MCHSVQWLRCTGNHWPAGSLLCTHMSSDCFGLLRVPERVCKHTSKKKKGKKKEYPRRQSLSGNHNKCNVCLWNTHESFISAPGHESHTTASLWWISSLAFTLSASTRLPFIPSKMQAGQRKRTGSFDSRNMKSLYALHSTQCRHTSVLFLAS